MAGRYQGYHVVSGEDGRGHQSIKVFWQHNGWFWRPCQPRGDAVGPFITSTAAYEHAMGAILLVAPRRQRMSKVQVPSPTGAV